MMKRMMNSRWTSLRVYIGERMWLLSMLGHLHRRLVINERHEKSGKDARSCSVEDARVFCKNLRHSD